MAEQAIIVPYSLSPISDFPYYSNCFYFFALCPLIIVYAKTWRLLPCQLSRELIQCPSFSHCCLSR